MVSLLSAKAARNTGTSISWKGPGLDIWYKVIQPSRSPLDPKKSSTPWIFAQGHCIPEDIAMGRIQEAFRPLEVIHDQEQYAAQGTIGWGNRHIYPIIPEHWTYTGCAYFTYWATAGEFSFHPIPQSTEPDFWFQESVLVLIHSEAVWLELVWRLVKLLGLFWSWQHVVLFWVTSQVKWGVSTEWDSSWIVNRLLVSGGIITRLWCQT